MKLSNTSEIHQSRAKLHGNSGRKRPDLALINKSRATHGMSATAVYRLWSGMLQRCLNPKSKDYAQYGARGIRVCRAWKNFANFRRDMGPRPKGAQLDRIDNLKGYSPSNCRWATRVQQANNKSVNRRIVVKGRAMTIAEWARELGVSRQVIRYRLEAGWPPALIVTTPPNHGNKLERIAL